MKRKKGFFYLIFCVGALGALTACADDESFSTSRGDVLSFSADTVMLDTVFSNVPTPTHSFWVYNRSGRSLRCQSVRLENGNQMGFRVNVDGAYLGASAGYRAQDVEIRRGDSARVFVELTAPVQHADEPQQVSDNLVFQLESGVEQKVCLRACAWDAVLLGNLSVDEDMRLDGEKPFVVRGSISVGENAQLSIAAGARLFFHEDAGIDVYGSLRVEGEKGQEVVMRGDRLDRMFSYLPYDRTPGRWQGIRLRASSHDNLIRFADIHSAYDGVVMDGVDAAADGGDAAYGGDRLTMQNATVHNCQGYGVKAVGGKVRLMNCLLSNALDNCLYVKGGDVELNGCTLAQFYPFDARRGAALCVEDAHTLLSVKNSLVTGYREDEVELVDGASADFFGSVVRMGKGIDVGEKHFRLIDTDNLVYDFHLAEESTAIGAADANTSLAEDRDGASRGEKPSAGCYEY